MSTEIDLYPVRVLRGSPKCRYASQTGSDFESAPHLPHQPIQGTLPWKWLPWKFRIRAPRLLRWIGVFLQAVAILVAAVLGGRGDRAVAGIVFCILTVFFVVPCFYLAYIMDWNFKLREGICWCLGKSVQATEQWKKTQNPETAKHVFFDFKVGSHFHLKVLNDGSQEIWNTTGDELAAELSAALGMSGFKNDPISADNRDSIYASAAAARPKPDYEYIDGGSQGSTIPSDNPYRTNV